MGGGGVRRGCLEKHKQKRRADLLGGLSHGPESLDVGVKEGVAVVHQAVLVGEVSNARLNGPQVVPRQLGK